MLHIYKKHVKEENFVSLRLFCLIGVGGSTPNPSKSVGSTAELTLGIRVKLNFKKGP
jgi:hypothetical protein